MHQARHGPQQTASPPLLLVIIGNTSPRDVPIYTSFTLQKSLLLPPWKSKTLHTSSSVCILCPAVTFPKSIPLPWQRPLISPKTATPRKLCYFYKAALSGKSAFKSPERRVWGTKRKSEHPTPWMWMWHKEPLNSWNDAIIDRREVKQNFTSLVNQKYRGSQKARKL